MEAKLKKVLLAILSIFFIFGGVVFSACTKDTPQAIINVSSADFVRDDYVEIDLSSDRAYAQITASVDNVSSGSVVANNNSESILSATSAYDAGTNTSLITITGVNEGVGTVELRSEEGDATKYITVFVYSDILGLAQKTTEPGQLSDQFVIRGQENVLEASRYLEITSRPNGESNRKDVVWRFSEEQENQDGLTLVDNILTVDSDFTEDTVKLKAYSVYTNFSADVTLAVVDQLEQPTLEFGRTISFGDLDVSDQPFTLIRNDDSQSEANIFVKLFLNGASLDEVTIDCIIKNSSGAIVSNISWLEQGKQSDGNPVYLIKVAEASVPTGIYDIQFELTRNNINQKVEAKSFQVIVNDVVDTVSVKADGMLVVSGSTYEIYNTYNTAEASDMSYGRPFVVQLGPNTVKDAYFVISSTANLSSEFYAYYQVAGMEYKPIVFTQSDDWYVSQSIPNNATLRFLSTKGNFINGDTSPITISSIQSPNVSISFNLARYYSPDVNFDINSGEYYFSTNDAVSEDIFFSFTNLGTNLSNIIDGLYAEVVNGDASNFTIGSIRPVENDPNSAYFLLSSSVNNISSANFDVRIYHKNGFYSKQLISINAFVKLTEASVGYVSGETLAVAEKLVGSQTDQGFTASNTLTKLIMRTSNTVTLSPQTNNAVTSNNNLVNFKYYAFEDGFDPSNIDINESGFTQEELSDETKYSIDLVEWLIEKGYLVESNSVTYSLGRLTTNADSEGYVVFSFNGFDENHNALTIRRWFYLESYTAPTSLTANPQSISLTARDTVGIEDLNLTQTSVRISFRFDGKPIKHFEEGKFTFTSSADKLNVKLSDATSSGNNYYYQVVNVVTTSESLKFDIIAYTIGAAKTFVDTLVVEYSDYNVTYKETIDIKITSATRVSSVVWENQTEGGIYLDLYGENISDKQFLIITSVQPNNAYKSTLEYKFYPNSATSASIVKIDDLGIVSIARNTIEGGTGFIYVYPSDAVRQVAGVEQLVYYTEDSQEPKYVRISELNQKYDEIKSGYFIAEKNGDDETRILYSEIILQIPITIADGRNESTARRIYTAQQVAELNPDLHYVLMNSIELSSDYDSKEKVLNGSFKGFDENVSIKFTNCSPLFDKIGADGKVENLTLYGEVNGGGFVANINDGTIKNLTITTSNNGEVVTPSKVFGGFKVKVDDISTFYAGAIVGVNNGIIGAVNNEVYVKGVQVNLDQNQPMASAYAGTFVGKNTSTISYTYGEFYIFSKDTQDDQDVYVVNTITADYVGGFVGFADGGNIEHCYVYNYSAYEEQSQDGSGINIQYKADALKGGSVGAFIGYSETEWTLQNSFALLNNELNNVLGNETTNYIIRDVYYGVNLFFDSYGTADESKLGKTWLSNGEEGFCDYVRGGKPHLKFYQEPILDDLSGIVIQKTSKSILVEDETENANRGIIFFHKLKNSYGLSEASQSALNRINTLSFKELFGEENIIVSSSNSAIIEIVGNQLFIKDIGDVTLSVSSRHDYSLEPKVFEIKVMYVLENFAVLHNGVDTFGFSLQEGRSTLIEFSVKQSIYLANETEPREIYLPNFKYAGTVDTPNASFDVNGSLGILSLRAMDSGNTPNIELQTWVELSSSQNDSYAVTIKNHFLRNLSITPFKGANDIWTNVETLRIDPSTTSKVEITLLTDSSTDYIEIELTREINQEQSYPLTFSLDQLETRCGLAEESTVTAYYSNQLVFNITVTASPYVSGKIVYTLAFQVDDNYRSKISDIENYQLHIYSHSGTSSNEGKIVKLAVNSQSINYVDITNYNPGSVTNKGGSIVYTVSQQLVSILSPGKSSFMFVNVDPSYAYYEYMTLTYQAYDTKTQQLNSSILTITNMEKIPNYANSFVVNYENLFNVVGGIGVKRSGDDEGNYVFRLYVSPNIQDDTTFIITVSFYDKDGNFVADPVNYELYASVLPQAEILVDGSASALLARGGSAELSILLEKGQELDSLSTIGTKGISISPIETWARQEQDDGTVLYTGRIYASLDAGIINKNDTISGTFDLSAVVSRTLNGEREEKISTAEVTIINFKPVRAELVGAEYNEDNDIYNFTSHVGITNILNFNYIYDPQTYVYDESDSQQADDVSQLLTARAKFSSNGYYNDAESGFFINCDENGTIKPIYERLQVNGSYVNFTEQSENCYIYQDVNIRLTYTKTTEGNSYLSVTGLRTTSVNSPIYITVIDEIRLKGDGKAVLYEIETNFAISVEIYSDHDRALIIQTAEEFLGVAEEGEAQDYILLNDITLENYTPISSEKFRSFDGNGYTINIKSFNMEGSGALDLALFSTVASNSVIQNVTVNYYQTPIDVNVTSSGYSTIRIAGFAVVNNGIITNCRVVSYNPNEDEDSNQGFFVNYLQGSQPYYIVANSSINSQVAGFVVENSGSITNSKVGGEDIIIIGEEVSENPNSPSDRYYYTLRELSLFTLSAQGTVAGFVISNSGDIASSTVSKIQINNLSASDQSETAGFVNSNSGKIRASAVQGLENSSVTDDNKYHRTGSSISARGIVSGFVVYNRQAGQINDGYSNILLSSKNSTNSIVSAGFVYQNEGTVSTSYSGSAVEANNAHQLSFSGYDSKGNSLNSGSITLSYYFIADQGKDSSSDVQASLNDAYLIQEEEVGNQDAYYGFVFNSDSGSQDGVWIMVEGSGVEPLSLTKRTVSHRYYVAYEGAEEYFLPYAILQNRSDNLAEVYDTTYGEEINPILINSAQDFKEAMGDSTATSIMSQFTDTEILGAYRFTTDIDLSLLNDELGNAEIQSVNKTFKGIIDGNGFTISNISLSSKNSAVGLFGRSDGALIQNLNLEIDSVAAGSAVMVGALIGYAKDTKIINVAMTQLEATGQNDERGVLGRNATGGIVGAVFGNSRLNGLSVSGAIVQSGYYNSETNSQTDNNKFYLYSHGSSDPVWKFDQKAIRRSVIEGNFNILISDGYLGSASFAGGIVGYADIYSGLNQDLENYVYTPGLTTTDYSISSLRVNGSIEVRGEVVGGAIGYTGVHTRVQDAGIYITNAENTTAKILSYNFIAGGLIGMANGDFFQVFAQHTEELQNEIENSTKLYYQDGNKDAQRGVLNLFEETNSSQTYKPLYVGGLFGVMGNGQVYVAYSKLNAINNTNGGYAGGLAGAVYSANNYSFIVEDSSNAVQNSTSLLLKEVYISGDVFANGVAEGTSKADHFGGLFGIFIADDTVDGKNKSSVKLNISAVNSFAEYGILNSAYSQTTQNAIKQIDAFVGTSNDASVVITKVLSSAESTSNYKSYGYMKEYNSGSLTVNIVNQVLDSLSTDDKKMVFDIESVSSYLDAVDGYNETNGAFINSNAWSIENWTHLSTSLYPSINLRPAATYIYLDQDNIREVLGKMQNSSIEVRVRGRNVENGVVTYSYVDLSEYLKENEVSEFSGRLIGASDDSWFKDGNIIYPDDYDIDVKNAISSSYPGIIIDRSLFSRVGNGTNFQNLNVISVPTDFKETQNTQDPIEYSFIRGNRTVKNAVFNNVRVIYTAQVELKFANFGNDNDNDYCSGLLVSNAENTSFVNVLLYFSSQNLGSDEALVTISENNGPSSNTDTAKDYYYAGLLAGKLTQTSNYETLKVQNITIRHQQISEDYDLLQVDTGTGKSYLNVGLYVGAIENSQENDQENDNNIVGVNVSAKMPEYYTPEETQTNDKEPVSSISVVGNLGEGYNQYLGGFVGKISARNTTFTFNKTSVQGFGENGNVASLDYNQKIIIKLKNQNQAINQAINNDDKPTLYVGGMIGELHGNFSTFVDSNIDSKTEFDINIDGDNQPFANFELKAGLLIGEAKTGSMVNISSSSDATFSIAGSISSEEEFAKAYVGGLIGKSEATTSVEGKMDISFCLCPNLDSNTSIARSAMQADTSSSFTVSGDIYVGTLIGATSSTLTITGGVDSSKEPIFKVNSKGENIDVKAGGDVYAGGLVGYCNSSSIMTVTGNIENKAVLIISQVSKGSVNAGGVIGFSYTKNLSVCGTASDVNIFVGADNLNAGGLIGVIKTDKENPSTSTTTTTSSILANVFSGAIKVQEDEKVQEGELEHNVGGAIGVVDSASEFQIIDNIIYGDVIYSSTDQLSTYCFGGIVGDGNEAQLTLNNNIVAFTNNNQNRGKNHYVDALVGNSSQSNKYDTNYYCSQLVLATAENEKAIDLNYNIDDIDDEVKGYTYLSSSNANQSGQSNLNTAETIINKLSSFVPVEGYDVPNITISSEYIGTKLNPITDKLKTDDPKNTNGITYYTSYNSAIDYEEGPYAYVGDWKERKSVFESLTQNSFISGVWIENNITDKEIDSSATTGTTLTTSTTQGVGGIVNQMEGGVIFACYSSGTMSVGGSTQVDLGGIVGSMTAGYINDCVSSVNITYRAAKGGTASGIATVSEEKESNIFINNTFSTGVVSSYIDANLYSFTNGNSKTKIFNSYTISRVDWNDFTSSDEKKREIGFVGDETSLTNFKVDKNALGDAYSSNIADDSVISPVAFDKEDQTQPDSKNTGWVNNPWVNYGYPYRNFGIFNKIKTATSTDDKKNYTIYIPNATKLAEWEGLNYNDVTLKLTQDIDFSLTEYANTWESIALGSAAFDGGENTISNIKNTLFKTVGNISNLRVIDACIEDAQATVAVLVSGEAKNVIATGELNTDNKGSRVNLNTSKASSGDTGDNGSTGETTEYDTTLMVGGLFAVVDGSITGCKNYVEMNVTIDGIDIGGVVGKAFSGGISSCFNYAPINAVNKETKVGKQTNGGCVGGIAGSCEGGTITGCGNENTVFNGYTSGGDGIYRAAGIVAWTNNSNGSIKNCYNTSMIKAGNTMINATSGYSSAAAGIVASTTGTVSNCTNTGFIEALGSTKGIKTSFSTDNTDNKNWSEAGDPLKSPVEQQGQYVEELYNYIYYKINSDEIYNVFVSSIGLTGASEVDEDSNKNEGSVFRNGLFGPLSGKLSVFVPGLEPGTKLVEENGEKKIISQTLVGIDFEISYTTEGLPTPIIAETDELGAMTKFYIKSTRTIKYNNNSKITRTQTRYWRVEDINQLLGGATYGGYYKNYYAQQAVEGSNKKSYKEGSGSELFGESAKANDSSATKIKSVKIGDDEFVFVETASQLVSCLENGIFTATISLDEENEKLKGYLEKGYSLSYNFYDDKGNPIDNLMSSYSEGEGEIKIKGYGEFTIGKITIQITKPALEKTINVSMGNINKVGGEDGTNWSIVITQNGLDGLVGGQSYSLELTTDDVITEVGDYKWNSADNTLSKSFENAAKRDGEYEAIKAADSVRLDKNQHIVNFEYTSNLKGLSNMVVPGLKEVEEISSINDIKYAQIFLGAVYNGASWSFEDTGVKIVSQSSQSFYSDGIIALTGTAKIYKNNFDYVEFGGFEKTYRQGAFDSKASETLIYYTPDQMSAAQVVLNFSVDGNYNVVNYTVTYIGNNDDASTVYGTLLLFFNLTAHYDTENQNAGLPTNQEEAISFNKDSVSFDAKAQYILDEESESRTDINSSLMKGVAYSYYSYSGKYKLSKFELKDKSEKPVDYSFIYGETSILKKYSGSAQNDYETIAEDINGKDFDITITQAIILDLKYNIEDIIKEPFNYELQTYDVLLTSQSSAFEGTYDEEFNAISFEVENGLKKYTIEQTDNETILKVYTKENDTWTDSTDVTTTKYDETTETMLFESRRYTLLEVDSENGPLYYLYESYLGQNGVINVNNTSYYYNYDIYNSKLTISNGSEIIQQDDDELIEIAGTSYSYFTFASTTIVKSITAEAYEIDETNTQIRLGIDYNKLKDETNLTYEALLNSQIKFEYHAQEIIILSVSEQSFTLKDVFGDIDEPGTWKYKAEGDNTFTNITVDEFIPESSGKYSFRFEFTGGEITIKDLKVVAEGSGDEERVKIILVNDIDLKTTHEIATKAGSISSLNNNIINFRIKGGMGYYDDSLLAETVEGLQIKNVSFAGSVSMFYENGIEDAPGHFAIIAKNMEGCSLLNVTTYGTLYQPGDVVSYNIGGGVAYSFINSTLNNVVSYASLSHNTANIERHSNCDYFGNMAGIAWKLDNSSEESESLVISVEYKGSIFGANGAFGILTKNYLQNSYNEEEKDGKCGQTIYPVFATADQFSSMSAKVFALLKAGDGGNGARGSDGKGSNDYAGEVYVSKWMNDWNFVYGAIPSAGESGKVGGGAGGGGAVKYPSQVAKEEESNDLTKDNVNEKTTIEAKGGTAGFKGNDGYAGLNLQVYVFNRKDGTGEKGWHRIGTDKENILHCDERMIGFFEGEKIKIGMRFNGVHNEEGPICDVGLYTGDDAEFINAVIHRYGTTYTTEKYTTEKTFELVGSKIYYFGASVGIKWPIGSRLQAGNEYCYFRAFCIGEEKDFAQYSAKCTGLGLPQEEG